MTALAVGLAGLGRMGRIHAGNLAGRCTSARLACVFDVDPLAAREIGEAFEVPWVTSFAELTERVDAVAVATSTGSHAELSVAAARAGKHVFCEKPVSLDRATTVSTLDAVAETGVVFQVGFHRRFDPDWAAAAERIRSGELGEVSLLRSSLRDMASPPVGFLAGSGGFFRDVAVHDLDLARWLGGEVVEVTAHGATADPEFATIDDVDTAVVVLRFENGALGVLDGSRSAGYGYEASTEVMGTRATVRIDAPARHGYRWRTAEGESTPLVRDFAERFPAAYVAELDGFAAAVRHGTPPRVGGADALAAFDLAEAADLSHRTGRSVPVHPERTDSGVVYRIDSAARG